MKELVEDLTRMGCEGLLAKPWNLRNEAVLREFLFARGNQWERTMRQDPKQWTAEVWADVYGFAPRKGEGWASWNDTFFVGKFRTEQDPKDGFYPIDCRNPRDRRVTKFLLPILYPEIPKRLSITMANTLFGALSGKRPINWGRLIQELVEKSIPHIGKKPSPLSRYILHLYQQNGCVNEAEEDALAIAEDEVTYKLGPKIEITEAGSDESSGYPVIPEPPPAAPIPETRRAATPQPRNEAGPSKEQPWRDIDLSTFELLETPFKRARAELITNLQNQYWRLEHITHGVSRALGNCGPKNILWELAKKTDRSKVDALETEKAQLAAQVAAMTQELAQKSEEIRRYQAEHTVVVNRVRELVGHPGEIVNKAHLYDQLMESADPFSARQTLQILVKYSRSMKDPLKEVQKLLPPRRNLRRVLDPGSPGSPPANRYEVASKVDLIPTSQAAAGASGQQETGRVPERKKTQCRKGPGRHRFGERVLSDRRGQGGPNPMCRAKTSERTKTPDHGKGLVVQALQPPAPDCMIVEKWGDPPSQTLTARERRITPTPCGRNRERMAESDHSPNQSIRKKKQKVPAVEPSGSEDGSWEGPSAAKETDEKVTPSWSMRKIFTRLQEWRFLIPGGGASAINGPTN
jgi:hypothetical protein